MDVTQTALVCFPNVKKSVFGSLTCLQGVTLFGSDMQHRVPTSASAYNVLVIHVILRYVQGSSLPYRIQTL